MTNDNYLTDFWIKDIFKGWFDPCEISNDIELRTFDGLGSSWKDRSFVNPPYSTPLKWVEKAIEENKKGKLVVLLLKVDTSTKWFSLLQNYENSNFLWINGRLKYETGKPCPFPSCLVVLGVKNDNDNAN